MFFLGLRLVEKASPDVGSKWALVLFLVGDRCLLAACDGLMELEIAGIGGLTSANVNIPSVADTQTKASKDGVIQLELHKERLLQLYLGLLQLLCLTRTYTRLVSKW
jgi:hypothetical protein